MNEIHNIIERAKNDLFEYFSIAPNVVWKEEDLQSYLYHRLLVIEPKLKERLHREIPVIISSSPRDWAGMLDLAITEKSNNNFCVEDVRIDCAIELKFVRYWKTGLSPKSLSGFEKECIKDINKLQANARNFKKETMKYFLAFRLTETPQIDEVRKIFEKIDWNGIQYDYIECYADGSECKIL